VKVAVLKGGRSLERGVSLRSGAGSRMRWRASATGPCRSTPARTWSSG
jgi:D-alanine-D-alanine ligase-like ATP-grasp enzyme